MKPHIVIASALSLAFSVYGFADASKLELASGAWIGDINQKTTVELPGGNGQNITEVLVLNCGIEPEIWVNSENDGFIKIHENYVVQSKAGNTILSLIVDGGGWVETQNWAFVEIDEISAYVQWNRVVSNLGYDSNHEYRSFGQLGHGYISKVSEECDIFE